ETCLDSVESVTSTASRTVLKSADSTAARAAMMENRTGAWMTSSSDLRGCVMAAYSPQDPCSPRRRGVRRPGAGLRREDRTPPVVRPGHHQYSTSGGRAAPDGAPPLRPTALRPP